MRIMEIPVLSGQLCKFTKAFLVIANVSIRAWPTGGSREGGSIVEALHSNPALMGSTAIVVLLTVVPIPS